MVHKHKTQKISHKCRWGKSIPKYDPQLEATITSWELGTTQTTNLEIYKLDNPPSHALT
jgi:hypothetical protein